MANPTAMVWTIREPCEWINQRMHMMVSKKERKGILWPWVSTVRIHCVSSSHKHTSPLSVPQMAILPCRAKSTWKIYILTTSSQSFFTKTGQSIMWYMSMPSKRFQTNNDLVSEHQAELPLNYGLNDYPHLKCMGLTFSCATWHANFLPMDESSMKSLIID